MTGGGFPHSGIPGSSLACQLAEAYRRLLRPSSLSGAKASTLCPSLLVHQDAANALQQARNPPETFDVYHLSLCEISMNRGGSRAARPSEGPKRVETSGLEPLTPCVQSRCSPS